MNSEQNSSPIQQTSKSQYTLMPIGYNNFINVSRDIITISEEKLKLNAIAYDSSIKSAQNWHTPLGILISIGITLCTVVEFQPVLFFSKSLVRDLFVGCFGACLLWLIHSLHNHQNNKISTPDEFVAACKNLPNELEKDN